MPDRALLLGILDQARWAPSGDNTQPWRFEIVGDDRLAIHGSDTRSWCLYDFDGHASHLAHGALLETIRISASREGCDANWRLRDGCDDSAPIYDVRLTPSVGIETDPLYACIEARSVQRRPMRMKALGEIERAALLAAVGPEYELHIFESVPERLAFAHLLWRNAHLRLTCPEAYRVHREIIEWGARFSTDRIPERAVGVDPLTARLMRWVMASWTRVEFFNKYLLGTVAPRIQLDLVPAVACAAHVLIKPRTTSKGLEDFVAAGAAMQRLWLTATLHGLWMQPEMTPLIFRWYVQADRKISARAGIDPEARELKALFEKVSGFGADEEALFLARVGWSSPPTSRSLRRPLDDLMV